MKSFAERNPFVIGLVGIVGVALLVLAALNYQQLPGFNQGKTYSAHFDDAGGLYDGAEVQVSGFASGKVTGIS